MTIPSPADSSVPDGPHRAPAAASPRTPAVIVRTGEGPSHWVGFHGWGGDHRTFSPVLPWLPADASFHAVELPGYGSTAALPDWTVDAMREVVVDAIDRIPGERFTFVGNCSGAILGLLGALERPERIERIVLIDPFAFVPWYFRLLLLPGVGRLAYRSAFANPVGRWITNSGLRRHRAEGTDMTASFVRVDHDAAWETLRLLAEVATIDRFAPLVRPTAILHGENTFRAIHQSIVLWRALWPHVEVHELGGAGHLPIQEATAHVADTIFATA